MKDYSIINEKTFEAARKKIKESKGIIVFSSEDDELNRKVAEQEKINILLLNQLGRKDNLKQRNSGFNKVLAKIAKRNNVTIGINLDEIILTNGKIKSEILARIHQNIIMCNKNNLKMKFIYSEKCKRDIYDLKALGLVLGMSTKTTKEL